MFIIVVAGFEVFEKSVAHCAHVRVSEDHVVRILDHSSAKLTFTMLVKAVVGLDTLVIVLIVIEIESDSPLLASYRHYYGRVRNN